MRMARVLLDHSEKLQDFLKARVLEHKAFRLESDIRELIRAFDGREIEAKIFAFDPSERLVLNRYTKVGRFVHNAPTCEEERDYAEEHEVIYPVEVDVVAEREVAGRYHILITEVALQVDGFGLEKAAKKAGAVEAYYQGKSKFEASESRARCKPVVEGVWFVTSQKAEVNCEQAARKFGIRVIDVDGSNLLFKAFGMRRLPQ